MIPPSEGDCASCGKRTTKHCTRCGEGVDMDGHCLMPTFYCSTDCQKSEFAAHKAACQSAAARQQLYRGGELLRQVFYAFREVAFDLSISQVIKSEDGELRIFLDSHDRNGSNLSSFPDHLVPDSDEKKAILAHNSCPDALVHLPDLSRMILKGITSSKDRPQEVEVVRKQMPPVIEVVQGNRTLDTNQDSHHFIVATLKNGESYAINLAGAQYRQYSPVKPLAMYENSYVVKYEDRDKLGYYAGGLDILLDPTPDISSRYGISDPPRAMAAKRDVAKAMISGIRLRESRTGKLVSDVLREKEADFDVDKKEFLASVRKDMLAFIDARNSRCSNFQSLWSLNGKDDGNGEGIASNDVRESARW